VGVLAPLKITKPFNGPPFAARSLRATRSARCPMRYSLIAFWCYWLLGDLRIPLFGGCWTTDSLGCPGVRVLPGHGRYIARVRHRCRAISWTARGARSD
jgi:hypothetical protein